MLTRNRKSTERSLLRHIWIALDRKWALAAYLRNVSKDFRGRYDARINHFADLLDDGVPLPSAITQSPDLFSPETRSLAASGAQVGLLHEALQCPPQFGSATDHVAPFSILFLPVAILALWFVRGFPSMLQISIRVVPTLVEIERSTNANGSPVQIHSFHELEEQLPFLLVATVCLLLLLTLWVGRGSHFASARRGWSALRFGWSEPLRAFRVLHFLSFARRLGRPLAATISSMARSWDDRPLRGHLLYVRNEMEHGESCWEALQHRRLLSPAEARSLRAADYLGNTVWQLEFLARLKKQIGNGRERLLIFCLSLAALLVFAFMVWSLASMFFLGLSEVVLANEPV